MNDMDTRYSLRFLLLCWQDFLFHLGIYITVENDIEPSLHPRTVRSLGGKLVLPRLGFTVTGSFKTLQNSEFSKPGK